MTNSRNPFTRKMATGAAAAMALILPLAACGGGGGSTGSSASGAGSAEASATGSASAATATCDLAPDYPKGPIEIIVPWAAGGGTDGVARLLANELAQREDVQVNVVNRTGGSGVVGHTAMADADPDGQTLGLVTVEIGMMHYQGLTDLTAEDLTLVAQVNQDPAAITVAADAKWNSAKELMDDIKANPGTLRASGTGQGGIWHLALIGLLLDQGLPADAVTFVPSEGAAPGLQEMVAGGVDMTNNALGESKTMLDAGRAKALAVMGTEKDANFPDVPTTKEELGSDYTMGVWRGIAAPAGLDENIVAELECHVEEITNSDGFVKFMGDSGYGIKYRNSEDFTEFAKEDDTTKGEVMEAAGLKK